MKVTRLLVVAVVAGVAGMWGYRLGQQPDGVAPVAVLPPTVAPVAVKAVEQVEVEGVESREGRLAALALAEENEVLRERVTDLQGQVEQLFKSVAEERMEADLLRAGQARSRASGPGWRATGQGMPAVLGVADADPTLGLVALAGGEEQGLRPGMRFEVLNEDRRIARLRLVEVRPRLSAAVVEQQVERFPERGDRVIPVTAP